MASQGISPLTVPAPAPTTTAPIAPLASAPSPIESGPVQSTGWATGSFLSPVIPSASTGGTTSPVLSSPIVSGPVGGTSSPIVESPISGGPGDGDEDPVVTPPVEEPTDGGEDPVEEPGDDGGPVQETPSDGPLIDPVLLTPGTIGVDGGRVTHFRIEGDISSVRITDAPDHGTLTVNPDNTLALVLSGSDHSGPLSFAYEITRADGSTQMRSASLDVGVPKQQAGWGQGKHYMLETDAEGELVIETGDNHRKVYVSGSDAALTRADIAALEGVSVSTVTGKWLLDRPDYGGSEGMALATDIGMELWYAMHPIQANPPLSSDWLLFEKGYTYEDTGRLIYPGYSGESPLHPMYISSWGEGRPPELVDLVEIYQLESQNIVFDDIALTGGVRNLGGENFLFNSIEFRDGKGGMNIQNVDGFTLRDSDLSHTVTSSMKDGYWSGASVAIFSHATSGLLMEGNIFHHNGWEDGYLPDGSVNGGVPPTMFSHNVYLQNTTKDVTFRDNIISQGASFGAQIRGGGFVEDNVFVDNNAAVNMLGGIYQGDGPIGNFTFFADNLITSGGHKTWTHGAQGALTWGLEDRGYDSTLLDNIIAHLADPNNPEELAAKLVTHSPLTTSNGLAYDDTIIFNWAGSDSNRAHVVENNTPGLNEDLANQTTIQNFAAQVLGKDKATIGELMDAILAGEVEVTADDIIAYFQAGFGVAPGGDGSATSHRFIPNMAADGIRWDNRINWDTEELPDAGDSVALGGNHVQYGGTTRLQDLDLGGGALHVNSGKLTVEGALLSSGATGQVETFNAGQLWINGYAGNQTLEIGVSGGRFANTGQITGETMLYAMEGQALLATSGGSYTLTQGSMMVVDGSDLRVGFDGASNALAALTMKAGSTLGFRGDAQGFSAIEEFRSGRWDQEGSPVTSKVTLDGTLQIDLSDHAGVAGSHVLIEVDELAGALDEIEFIGLGRARNATLVVDYDTDTVRLDLARGTGQATSRAIDGANAPIPTVTDDLGAMPDYQDWF